MRARFASGPLLPAAAHGALGAGAVLLGLGQRQVEPFAGRVHVRAVDALPESAYDALYGDDEDGFDDDEDDFDDDGADEGEDAR